MVQIALLQSLEGVSQSATVVIGHHHGLLAMSLTAAFISSYAAFAMAHLNRQTALLSHKTVSLVCFSLMLGIGIWAMHFIGMLAMELSVDAQYDFQRTAWSALPSIVSAFLALWLMQSSRPSAARVWGSGAIVCTGIALMHFSGLAAMQVDGTLYLSWSMVALSTLLGFGCSVMAFYAQQRIFVRDVDSINPLANWAPALWMTVAIASMHFGSLHSMQLGLDQPNQAAAVRGHFLENLPSNITAALWLGIATGCLILMLGMGNALLRYRDMWLAVKVRDARLRAMIDIAPEAVITIDAQGIIQEFNPQAQRIFGYSAKEVIGRNVAYLMPSPLAEQHDRHIQRHLGQPDKAISVNGREVLGKHKDGRLIPLQLAIGKASTSSGTMFVGYLQDISVRKRTDAQLRIAASVFEHVREGVAIVDANRNIADVNPAFLQLMEKHREDCVGNPLESLYEQADIAADMGRMWSTVASQHYWQGESIFTRSDGSTWRQRLSVSPVLNEGKRAHHFIAVISDVSARADWQPKAIDNTVIDSATGLATQAYLMERLTASLLEAHQRAQHVGLLLIQMSMGADAPSSVLALPRMNAAMRLTAQRLQQLLRNSDIVALYGSKGRIAVLLPALNDPTNLATLLTKVQAAIEQASHEFAVLGIEQVRLGWAASDSEIHSSQTLIEQAENNPRVIITRKVQV